MKGVLPNAYQFPYYMPNSNALLGSTLTIEGFQMTPDDIQIPISSQNGPNHTGHWRMKVTQIKSIPTSTAQATLSLYGGELVIVGSGTPSFMPTADANLVVLINTTPCVVDGMESTAFRLVCRTEQASFAEGVQLVTVSVNGEDIICADQYSCQVITSAYNTPYLAGVSPAWVTVDDALSLQGIFRATSGSLLNEISVQVSNSVPMGLVPEASDPVDADSFGALPFTLPSALPAGEYTLTIRGGNGSGYNKEGAAANGAFDFSIVPTIESVSPSFGTSYGQNLLITGKGFPENPQVLVGSLPCQTTFASSTQIQCTYIDSTQSLITQENGLFRTGSGAQVQRFQLDGFQGTPVQTRLKTTLTGQEIVTSTTTAEDLDVKSEIYTTYLKPTTTGLHTFKLYVPIAETVNVKISSAIPNGSVDLGTLSLTSVLSYAYDPLTSLPGTDVWHSPRVSSAPITLNEGSLYKLEVRRQKIGSVEEFFSLGIDSPAPSTQTNSNCSPMIVKIDLGTIPYHPEAFQVLFYKINTSNGGRWAVSVPADATLGLPSQTSRSFLWNETATNIQNWFLIDLGWQVVVTRVPVDNTGADNSSPSALSGYRLTVTFTSPRSSRLSPVLVSTLKGVPGTPVVSSLSVLAVQSETISGEFRLIVNTKTTNWIPYDASAEDVWKALVLEIGELESQTQVVASGTSSGGQAFQIILWGDRTDYVIIPDGSRIGTSLGTPFEIATSIVQAKDCTIQSFQSIPTDMLFQYGQSKPSVTIEGGAICSPTTCGFTVSNILAKTSSYALTTGDFIQVGLTQQLPADVTSAQVLLGGFTCQPDPADLSSTLLQCLVPSLEAGAFEVNVEVIPYGLVPPVDSQAIMITRSPEITTVDGVLGGGLQGETVVTITGNYFSPSSTIVGILVEGTTVQCLVKSVTRTWISCLTTVGSGAYDLVVAVNDINFSFPFAYSVDSGSAVPSVDLLSQFSASPVEKTQVKVTGSGFGGVASILHAFIESQDASQSYTCAILEETLTNTEFDCILPGGKSGSYYFLVSREGAGISTTLNSPTFVYELVVTDSQPKFGSRAGGTEITITGRNFSPVPSSNLVFIGETGSLCTVTSSTTSSLACTTPALTQTELARLDQNGNFQSNIYVLTKLVEEATVEPQADFTFEFRSSSTPTINDVNPLQVSEGDTVTVQGTNFDQGTVRVLVEGVEATILSASPTIIEFVAPSLPYNLDASITVLVDNVGLPEIDGTFSLKYPVIVSRVSPSELSQGGGLVTVSGSAFAQGMQVHFGGNECRVIEYLSLNELTCELPALPAGFNSEIGLEAFIQLGSIFSCALPSTSCSLTIRPSLTSLLSTITPDSSLSSTGSGSILFDTQLNLNLEALTGSEVVRGILVSSVNESIRFESSSSINSLSSFQATFSTIPPGIYTPFLEIGSRGYALNTLGTEVQINFNAQVLGSGTTQSSFAGGAQLAISLGTNQPPLETAAGVEVTVCGSQCQGVQFESGSLVCQTPSFVSKVTQSLYNLVAEAFLLPKAFIADSPDQDLESILEESASSFYSSQNPDCNIGYDFGEGFKVEFSQILFAPVEDENEFILANFRGMSVQVSNDQAMWTTVALLEDSDLVPGFNQIFFATPVSSRFVRFRGDSLNQCRLAVFKVYGRVYSTQGTTAEGKVACPVKLSVGGLQSEFTLGASVYYTPDLTVELLSISPASGSSFGGETVTLVFSAAPPSTPTIKLGGFDCTNVTAISSTQYTCVTSAAVAQDETVEVLFTSGRAVQINNLSFTYVNKWSDPKTWGGESPPREGDVAYVPFGMTVILDESTPVLGAVVVLGKLIFDRKDLALNAKYIFLNGGTLQIGTEESPFTNKAVITLYGDPEQTKEFPFSGSKLIYGRSCEIQMFGEPRVTYTRLSVTAAKGSSVLYLQEPVDWRPNEKIAIGPTGYDFEEAEERVILSVSEDKLVVTLTEPLAYEHGAYLESIGVDRALLMSAEVALLDRSIVIQGDEDSDRTLFGAHVMVFSNSIGKFSYVESFRGGQQSIMARYPLHFHLAGNVLGSYIKGCSIHHSYNRAVTLHGVNNLVVDNNVAYEITGHAFFIEDGIEMYNTVTRNLAMKIRRNFSFLKSDVRVSAFWMTNPNNYINDNIASGCDGHGFWFGLVENPQGPSFTTQVCPRGLHLGSFDRNEAHSVSGNGLFIFEEWIPRERPCDAWEDFIANPPVTAVLNDFVGYKNKINGVLGERIGGVTFSNFTLVDNLIAGFEIGVTGFAPNVSSVLQNSVIIGVSSSLAALAGTEAGAIQPTETVGIWGPRTEGYIIDNVRLINFPAGTAGLTTCSHCFDIYSQDSTRNSLVTQNMVFQSVVKRVRWTDPQRDIIKDNDGTLTELVGGGWVTPYFIHNAVPACVLNDAVFSGLVCDNSIQIRRLAFYEAIRTDNFYGSEMLIKRLSTPFESEKGPESQFSQISFRLRDKPTNSWTAPFVTGEIYNIHWRNGIDWEELAVEGTSLYEPQDFPIYLQFNYTDDKESFVTNGTEIPVEQLPSDPKESALNIGDYGHNQAEKCFLVVYRGQDSNPNSETESKLFMEANRCQNCGLSVNTRVTQEKVWRLWSSPSSWPSGVVPQEGDDVEILTNWRMMLDVDAPKLNKVTILGTLRVKESANLLSANSIFIRDNANLEIGNQTQPYLSEFKIELLGKREDPAISLGADTEGGSKVLIVSGKLTIYSISADKETITRLSAPLTPSSSVIQTRTATGWVVGDEIVIGSSGFEDESETFTIIAVGMGGMAFTLDRAPTYEHSGSAGPLFTDPSIGTLDVSAEVGLLTHNVKIVGADDSDWGGCLYNPKYNIEGGSVEGEISLNGVELYRMGQFDSQRAGIYLTGNTYKSNLFNKVSVHHSNGFWVNFATAGHITMTNSVFYSAVKIGVKLNDSPFDSVFSNNLLIRVSAREFIEGKVFDVVSSLLWSSTESPSVLNFEISNNIISGADAGFSLTATKCSTLETIQNTVFGNILHSNLDGMVLLNNMEAEDPCIEISDVVAYRNREDGIISYTNSTEIRAKRLVIASNKNGVTLNQGWNDEFFDGSKASLKNSVFYGVIGDRNADYEVDIGGVRVPVATENMKGTLPNAYQFPLFKPNSNALSGSTLIIEECIVRNMLAERNVTFIQSNFFAGDTSSLVTVGSTSFENMTVNDLAYFVPAFENDCATFICSGLANILLKITSFQSLPTFYAIPKSSETDIMGNLQDCSAVPSWSGYLCNEEFGLLNFRSLDSDYKNRSFAPVYVDGPSIGTATQLTNYKDYFWVSFWRSDLFPSIFNAAVRTSQRYEVSSFGTFATKSQFSLYKPASANGEVPSVSWLVVELFHESAFFLSVSVNGVVVAPEVISATSSINLNAGEMVCGTNIYKEDTQSVEFVVTSDPSCVVQVEEVKKISISLRLSITVSDFYDEYGLGDFVTTLAMFLGLDYSQIRIATVEVGSTILSFNIIQRDDQEIDPQEVTNKMVSGFRKGDLDFGGALLNIGFVDEEGETHQKSFSYSGGSEEETSGSLGLSPTILVLVVICASLALVLVLVSVLLIRATAKKNQTPSASSEKKPTKKRSYDRTQITQRTVEHDAFHTEENFRVNSEENFVNQQEENLQKTDLESPGKKE